MPHLSSRPEESVRVLTEVIADTSLRLTYHTVSREPERYFANLDILHCAHNLLRKIEYNIGVSYAEFNRLHSRNQAEQDASLKALRERILLSDTDEGQVH